VPLCENCGARFPFWLRIDGITRNLSNRRYCLGCSPFGLHNTRQLAKPTPVERELPTQLRCPRCKKVKPLAEFYLRKDGRRPHSWCKVCNLEHRKARFREDRIAALLHYSAGDIKCACCGERTIDFLTLDHVNNDGAAHRRSLGVGRIGGQSFYARLRVAGYTYPYLAVACFNCNMARAFHAGLCPHRAM
jgi:hypothetical protein